MNNQQLAEAFLEHHDKFRKFRDPNYEGPCELIDINRVHELGQALLDFIANVISHILDAGSERDAVNENNELYEAICDELTNWVDEPET